MISISEVLEPPHVNLTLVAKDQEAAVEEVLTKLNGDPRITDFSALRKAVFDRNAPALEAGNCGICIAHGRTNAVHGLVMAAGRSPEGFTSPQIAQKVRLVFVAGIPSAFDSEYLRIVGTIARLCRDKTMIEKLLNVSDPGRFVELLASGETKL